MNKTTAAALIVLATLIHDASAQYLKMQPLLTFGTNGDGSIRPGDVDFLNSGGQLQRGLAWNPVTDHVLVACRTNPASPTIERVLILDAATGTNVGQLDMSSLALGGNSSFFINLIGIADDGAIYVGNLSNVQLPAEYRLYRWDNEAAAQTLVWYGDPASGDGLTANRRWGDTLAVRGAGTNTQVLIASRGTVVCMLRPTDSSMSTFYPTTLQTDTAAGALGYGLTFGAGDTFWGTGGANSGGPLLRLSFNLGAGTATTLQSFNFTNFPATVSPITVNTASDLLAGIDTRAGADFLRLYDISNLGNPPVFLDRETWVTNFNNNNFAGSIAFTTNGTIYALDGDNGIMAFTLASVATNPFPPAITLQPAGRLVQVGSNVVFTAAADGDAPLSYQWRFGTNDIPGATAYSITVTNAQLTNSGAYTFVVTNVFGAATSSAANLVVISNSTSFLAHEPFAYAVGPGTVVTNPGPWVLNSGTLGTIEADSLVVPGLAASSGNHYVWTSAAHSLRLPIGTNVSGTLFFAFALRIENIGTFTTSETIAGFTFGTGTSFASKINITNSAPGIYRIGLYKAGGTVNGSDAPNTFTTNDTVFVVSRYTFNLGTSTDDTCDLWLNPDPSTFGAAVPPTPTIAGVAGGTDLAQLDRFFLRAAGSGPPKKTVDELRIGYSWTDVTPPFVAPPPVLSIASVSTNVVVTWPTNYYGDYILQGNTSLTPNTWGSVTNPVTVSGTNYSVTIRANLATRYFRLIK